MSQNQPQPKNQPQPEIDGYKDELSLFQPEELPGLKKALQGVFPRAKSRARAQERFLTAVAAGLPIRHCLRLADMTWPQVSACLICTTGYKPLYDTARDCGNEIRRMDAEAALHERGTEGWREPVYYKGKRVGALRKFSDNCLLAYLRAEDPTKYREDASRQSTGPQVVLNLVMGSPDNPIVLGQQEPPTDYSALEKQVEQSNSEP